MKKKMPQWFAFLIIPGGGLLVLALVFASYYGAFLFAQNVLKINTNMNMGAVRAGYTAFLALLYIVFFVLVKGNDLLKATLLSGPTVMTMVTLIYQNMRSTWLMVLVLFLVPLIIAGIIRFLKKPWFYYYALVFSVIMAFWYGWPQ